MNKVVFGMLYRLRLIRKVSLRLLIQSTTRSTVNRTAMPVVKEQANI